MAIRDEGRPLGPGGWARPDHCHLSPHRV